VEVGFVGDKSGGGTPGSMSNPVVKTIANIINFYLTFIL